MFASSKANHVYIIAEIGVNHNGSLDLAKKLVYSASEAGVDAVKFQTFKAERLLSSDKIKKAPYQTRENSENQYTMLKRLELDNNAFKELKHLCDALGVDFISTPYDQESVILLKELRSKTVKIASADIINKYLIDKIIDQELNIILSAGMASYEEVFRTIEHIRNRNKDIEISLLHCTTSYPTDYADVNMNVLKKLQRDFGDKVAIGYSDHTEGNEIAIMAASLGARIIEKHFTLDRKMDGPDHFASIGPKELGALVSSIRNVEKAFGDSSKPLTKNELVNINVMRRSVHANKALNIGQVLQLDDLSITRPYDGYSAWDYEELLGKKLTRQIGKGEAITGSDII